MTTEVASPCIGVCKLDQKDICLGCYRSLQEIRQWSKSDEAGKTAIVERAEQRRQSGNQVA